MCNCFTLLLLTDNFSEAFPFPIERDDGKHKSTQYSTKNVLQKPDEIVGASNLNFTETYRLQQTTIVGTVKIDYKNKGHIIR